MSDAQTTDQDPATRPTVLVVDDERGPRQSLRMILQAHYEVIEAVDASEALAVLERRPVALMTLDLAMPGMGGAELMRIVRTRFPQTEIVIVTGNGNLDNATEALRIGVGDYLQKPFDIVQVHAAVSRCLQRRAGQDSLVEFMQGLSEATGQEPTLDAILRRMDADSSARSRVGDLIETLGAGQDNAIPTANTLAFLEVLADAVENQCGFLRGHARRTSYYAGLLADRIGLGPDQREHVRMAGFLHDIGKLAVPSEYLSRDGALTAKERAMMQRHPEVGARLVEPLGLDPDVAVAIRHHHEWWDGRGYGGGLVGDAIPLPARIIGLADAYDAMTCDRPYRSALSEAAARIELQKFAGSQFDPDLAELFLSLLDAADGDLTILAEPGAGPIAPPEPPPGSPLRNLT